jgi:hypothetical protein
MQLHLGLSAPRERKKLTAITEIEPELLAALSLHVNKGAFALLLGSGISRSAEIPTGWDIVIDLVRQLADLCGDSPADPIEWYERKYGEPPDYSKLLAALSLENSTQRVHLLEGYITPTDDDLSAKRKRRVPTTAHRTIASLVKRGIIRIIVTTNFDQLMEQALADVGIAPRLVRAAADIEHLIPIQHNACTLVKLHGDYTDARFRNTVEELSDYEAEWKALATRIFSEYGLLICGWSGQWDHKLRELLIQNCCKHFTTFWCTRAELPDEANPVIDARRGKAIMINDADSFFDNLNEHLRLLEDRLNQPLSTAAAVHRLKEYLADGLTNRIRITDMLNDEIESAWLTLLPIVSKKCTNGEAIDECNIVLQRLSSLFSILIFWSNGEFNNLSAACIARLIPYAGLGARGQDLLAYPASYLLYAVGMTCVLKDDFTALREVLFYEKTPRQSVGELLAMEVSDLQANMRANFAKQAFTTELLAQFQKVFYPLVRDSNKLHESYWKCEYLMGIAITQFMVGKSFFPPTGTYKNYGKHADLKEQIENQWKSQGGSYSPVVIIKDGWQQFGAVKSMLDQYVAKPPSGGEYS